jgi:hypothetical protein
MHKSITSYHPMSLLFGCILEPKNSELLFMEGFLAERKAL